MFQGIKDLRELKNLKDSLKYKFKVSVIPESQNLDVLIVQKLENLQSQGYLPIAIFMGENSLLWIISKKPSLKGGN